MASEAVHGGATLYRLRANPTMVTNSRLAQFARLYEYYRVHRLVFHFMASQPTTVTGSVVAYFDYDSEDPLVSSGDANIEGAFGHQVNHAAKLYESFDLAVGPDPSPLHREKWTQPRTATTDDADLDFGALVVLAMDEFSVTAPASLYNVYVTYDIELYGPNYEPATASTVYLERKAVPLAGIFSAGASATPVVMPIVHNATTGARDAAANLRKTMDELRGSSGALGDVIDTFKAGIKMATDMASATGVVSANATSYGSQVLLTPGRYTARITLSVCDGNGTLDTGVGLLLRNSAATRWGTDYLCAIWRPESGSPSITSPCVIQPFFYYNPGASGVPSVDVASKDMTYCAEFEVLRNAWVGFGIKSGNAGSTIVPAFVGNAGLTNCRLTFVLRKDEHFSQGVEWPATVGANAADEEPRYPIVVDGPFAYQYDPGAALPDTAAAAAGVAPLQSGSRRAQSFDDDEYDDVRSTTSSAARRLHN